jgi:hypothetical protein
VRWPLNEWQACEDARVDRHNSRIDRLRSLAKVEWLFALGIRMKVRNHRGSCDRRRVEEFEAQAHR